MTGFLDGGIRASFTACKSSPISIAAGVRRTHFTRVFRAKEILTSGDLQELFLAHVLYARGDDSVDGLGSILDCCRAYAASSINDWPLPVLGPILSSNPGAVQYRLDLLLGPINRFGFCTAYDLRALHSLKDQH